MHIPVTMQQFALLKKKCRVKLHIENAYPQQRIYIVPLSPAGGEPTLSVLVHLVSEVESVHGASDEQR